MPFPVAALIGAVGSVAAQALANNSASSINEVNNAQNDANRALTKYMYEDSKKYNSVQEQVKRLRAAGLNPAFALGGLQAGAATGQSVPSAIPNQMPDYSNASALANILNNGLQTDINAKVGEAQSRNLESQAKKNDQETVGLATDNLFKRENWLSIIGNRNTETFLKRQLGEVAKLDLQFNKESFQDRLLTLKYERELKDAQVVSQDVINQFLPHLQSATYNELVSRSVANYATGRASLQSAMAAVMNAKTEQGKVSAQFGDNHKERHDYYNAVMDLMFEQRQNYASGSFKNFLTAPVKIGLSEVSASSPLGVKLGKKIGDKYNK